MQNPRIFRMGEVGGAKTTPKPIQTKTRRSTIGHRQSHQPL